MALEAKVAVFEGPNRWNSLLGSLWEGKSVRFRLCGKTTIKITGYEPSEWLNVRIASMKREDGGRTPKNTDGWILEGEILDLVGGAPLGLVLRGNYNTHTRYGEFVIGERQYEGGDSFFGFRQKRGGSIYDRISVSECVQIS